MINYQTKEVKKAINRVIKYVENEIEKLENDDNTDWTDDLPHLKILLKHLKEERGVF